MPYCSYLYDPVTCTVVYIMLLPSPEWLELRVEPGLIPLQRQAHPHSSLCTAPMRRENSQVVGNRLNFLQLKLQKLSMKKVNYLLSSWVWQ